jgi:formylglycine-generating enzyme required for sulfatase activity
LQITITRRIPFMPSHRRGYYRLIIMLSLFFLMLGSATQTAQAIVIRVSIGWSASGEYIAVSDDFNSIKIFRTSTGELVFDQVLGKGPDERSSFEWSPTEDKLAVIKSNQPWFGSRIWMITPANASVVELSDAAIVRVTSTIAWHPDGRTFAVFVHADPDRNLASEIRVYDATSGSLLKSKEVTYNIRFLTWQPSGQSLAGSTAHGIIILDGESLEVEANWYPYNESFISMAWSPDGRDLVTVGISNSSGDSMVYGWREAKEANRRLIGHFDYAVYNPRWNHDGTQLVLSARQIIVLNMQTSEAIHTFEIDQTKGNGIAAWHPSLNKLVYAPTGDGYATVDIAPVAIAIASPTPQLGSRFTDGKGIEMVYVPPGQFMMGNDDSDQADERPTHAQTISAGFWLDLAPLTNTQYAAFIADGGYQKEEYWTPEGWRWVQRSNTTGPEDYSGFTDPDQPRVGINWHEAYAYAQWRGVRLPTEAEWEWAARGPENRIYPWGDEFIDDVEVAIWGGDDNGKPAKVGAGIRLRGASWVGALDMAGNVFQWTGSLHYPYPYQADDGRENLAAELNRGIRGCDWGCAAGFLRSSYRGYTAPESRYNSVGVRYARR